VRTLRDGFMGGQARIPDQNAQFSGTKGYLDLYAHWISSLNQGTGQKYYSRETGQSLASLMNHRHIGGCGSKNIR
jgi:hypothetical protein